MVQTRIEEGKKYRQRRREQMGEEAYKEEQAKIMQQWSKQRVFGTKISFYKTDRHLTKGDTHLISRDNWLSEKDFWQRGMDILQSGDFHLKKDGG